MLVGIVHNHRICPRVTTKRTCAKAVVQVVVDMSRMCCGRAVCGEVFGLKGSIFVWEAVEVEGGRVVEGAFA